MEERIKTPKPLLLTTSRVPSHIISKYLTTSTFVNDSYQQAGKAHDQAVKSLLITDLTRRDVERESQRQRDRHGDIKTWRHKDKEREVERQRDRETATET